MLDNMTVAEMQKAISLIRSKEKIYKKTYEIEISGGVSFDDLVNFRNLDVDRVSLGRITHSVESFDISLDF